MTSSAYTVTSSAEVVDVSKEIGKYEVVTGTKINREKSVGFRLGSWKGYTFPGHFSRVDSRHLVRSRYPAGEELVGSIGKSCSRNQPLAPKEFLKSRTEVSDSLIYPLVLFCLSVFPLPDTVLFNQFI